MARAGQLPQGAVRLNLSHPVWQRGLPAFFGSGASASRLIYPEVPVTSYGNGTRIGKGGVGFQAGSGASYSAHTVPGIRINTSTGNGSGDYSMWALCSPYWTGQSNIILYASCDSNGRQARLQFGINDAYGETNGAFGFSDYDGTAFSSAAINSGAYIAGGLHHYCGVRQGSTYKLYKDGVLVASRTQTIRNMSSATNPALGIGDVPASAAVRVAPYPIYQVGGVNHALSDAEVLDIAEAPWQLVVQPRRVWVQLGATGGTTATTYTVTGSGTVVFSGTPAYKRLVKTITSGGITYTGAGAAKDIHSPDTSGGISYTGTAVAKKLFAPLSSGGVSFTGDAVEKLIRSALAAGGLLFGGTAGFIPVLSGGTIYTVTPSGGIVFGSSAAVKAIHDSLSQGGLAYSGIAGYNLIREILAAGGLTFAGVAGVTGPSTGTGSLDQATIDAIALAVWQRVVDAGLTAEQLLRLLVSHAAGSATGLENGAPVFKSLDGTKDRITGTYAAGTRTVTGRDAT